MQLILKPAQILNAHALILYSCRPRCSSFKAKPLGWHLHLWSGRRRKSRCVVASGSGAADEEVIDSGARSSGVVFALFVSIVIPQPHVSNFVVCSNSVLFFVLSFLFPYRDRDRKCVLAVCFFVLAIHTFVGFLCVLSPGVRASNVPKVCILPTLVVRSSRV